MMRIPALLLLAAGLLQIAYAQVHCGLEPADCKEGACELCHSSDVAPLIPRACLPSPLTPTLFADSAVSRRHPLGPPVRRGRGRAPPL